MASCILWYLLVDHSRKILQNPTFITVDQTLNVDKLKARIKEKHGYRDVDSARLNVYRPNKSLNDAKDREKFQALVRTSMNPTTKVYDADVIQDLNLFKEEILLVKLPPPGPVGFNTQYLLFDNQKIVQYGSIQLRCCAYYIQDLRRKIVEDNSDLLRGVSPSLLEVYKCPFPERIDSSDDDKKHAQALNIIKDTQHRLRDIGSSTKYNISAGGLLLVKVPGVIRLITEYKIPFILVDCEKNYIGTSVLPAYLVADFKTAVKNHWPDNMRRVDAGKLIVWRRTNPHLFTCEEPESINFTNDTAIVLCDLATIGSLCLFDDEMLIVQIPESDSRTTDSDSSRASTQDKRLQVFRDAEKEPSPSKGAYVTSFLKHQEKNPIYNGRPAENIGVPVGLYHDAFNTFHAHLNRRDPPHPHASVTYENISKLLESFANIYGDEPSRSDTIMPLMTSILGYPIDVATQSDDSSEGTITTSCGEFEAFLAIVEMKNEIGTGNADPYNQAGLAYRKYWADKKHEPMVPFCHFPSFLIAIAGPWIMIAGAIFLDDKFIVEPLTDFIWLGGALHDSRREAKAIRLFSALETGISELESYYEDLDMQRVLSKFPFITSFGEDEREMRWKYCSRPYDEKLLYEAELEDGRQVIVKFASTYNEDAHQLLANEGYAPKLHHVSKRLYGGQQMIVMDRVTGRRLGYRERVTASQYSVLKEALRLLHAENIVHGDFRGPNIMVMEEEEEEEMGEGMKEMNCEVMLIDFDDCGKAGEGRYSADLNAEIGWPQGVEQESIMQLAHDIEMLNRLKPL